MFLEHNTNSIEDPSEGGRGDHDVFDINEVLKFAKISFSRREISHYRYVHVFSFGDKYLWNYKQSMFLIDYFCCISFMLQALVALLCTGGRSDSSFHAITF